MQRDTGGLTAENKELKLKLQAMEQQAHLRDGTRVSCYSSHIYILLITLMDVHVSLFSFERSIEERTAVAEDYSQPDPQLQRKQWRVVVTILSGKLFQ